MRIAKKRPSRELFLRAGLVGFFPLPAVLDLPRTRQAARILTVWPTIVNLRAGTDRALFEVGITGPRCGSAWKKDPVSGVIGVEKRPLIPVV